MAIPANRPFSHMRKINEQTYSLSVFIRSIDKPSINFNNVDEVEITYSGIGGSTLVNWPLIQINITKPSNQDYVQLVDSTSGPSTMYFHRLYYEDADIISTEHNNTPHQRLFGEIVSNNPTKFQYFPEVVIPLVGAKNPVAQKVTGLPTDTLHMEVTLTEDLSVTDSEYNHLEFDSYTDLNPSTGYFQVTTVMNGNTKGDGKKQNSGNDNV